MTPKEKAKELVEAMSFSCRECDYESKAKQCALIAIDEIINSSPLEPAHPYDYVIAEREAMEFWQEVKNEIQKI
jgi:hypothetical protein